MSKIVKSRKDGTLRVIMTERQAQLVLGIMGRRCGDDDFKEHYSALKAELGGENPLYEKVRFLEHSRVWWYEQ